VKFAYLEGDGQISVIKREQEKPPAARARKSAAAGTR
jgi:uncharacterized membrane protein YcaP (DUF421 family)